MRFRWIGGALFLLGVIALNVGPLAGQQPGGGFGGKGGKGGKKGGGQNGGTFQFTIPNNGQPGGQPGGGFQFAPQGGGGQPGGGFQFNPQGGNQPGGGFGGKGGGPGGGFGGKGGDRGAPGGGGGPGGGFGGPGGKGGFDPERVFGFFAQGGDVIDFGKMSPESRVAVRGRLERYGLGNVPDNAVITKAQFVEAANAANAARANSQGGPGGGPSMGGPGGPGFGPGGPGGPGGGDARIEGRDKKDKEKEKEPPVVAIRYGKLPAGLPDWFAELDTDKDGQVGLYEWRAAGKKMKEFMEYDTDGDGLIAPQELLRFTADKAEADRLLAIQEGERPSGSRGMSGGPGGSGKGFGGKGKGGMGFGGKGKGGGGEGGTTTEGTDPSSERKGKGGKGGGKGGKGGGGESGNTPNPFRGKN